jgi:aldose 1-epimerase
MKKAQTMLETIDAVVPIYLGLLPTGEVIWQYKLRNRNGVVATLMNYGATLMSLTVPDGAYGRSELTLGFDTLEEYVAHPYYFGCIIGRVANRIRGGKFRLHDNTYQLACNDNNVSHLHGGDKGFDKVAWQASIIYQENLTGVEFSYFSASGEENYPGNVLVKVIYLLTEHNELKIIYHGETDQSTPLNLTNHTYWNLNGAGEEPVLNHEMQIFSEYYLKTNDEKIPSGEIKYVAGTDFDFTKPVTLSSRVEKLGGYDHCFTLDSDNKMYLSARVSVPEKKRSLQVYTNQAAIHLYTGNYLSDYPIAHGKMTTVYGGFCLETQGYIVALNQTHFPKIILQPGEVYEHKTIYKIMDEK